MSPMSVGSPPAPRRPARYRPRAVVAFAVASLVVAAPLLALSPAAGAAGTSHDRAGVTSLTLTELISDAGHHMVRTAVVDSGASTVTGALVAGGDRHRYRAAYPAGFGGQLTQTLLKDGVSVSATPAVGGSAPVGNIALLVVPILLMAWLLVVAMRRRSGRPGPTRSGKSDSATNPAGFAKGHGEQVEVPATRFGDVAGLDEAVDSLTELVDYLREPERYRAAGAEMPRGYLLVGPPGTGKTLLARAVAGEAGVPFFAIGGSEFVESYVGVGAARVRTLFDRARAAEAAIIFIDELDAIGRSRNSQSVPGNEERESTLNQLLVELDGFNSSSVIILAATNRPDVLDAALLRPGRFDRQIAVPSPDRRGRLRILGLYLARRRVEGDIDLDVLAKRTAGFSGADLANLVNTAALQSVREGTDRITGRQLEEALATVSLGPARKSAVITEHDRQITAWHEAGHSLAGLWLADAADPISVSIVPRGQAGGVTWFPGHDDLFLSRRQAKAQLVVAMAGRVAEELYLDDDFTQGAAQDFRAATELARHMVTEYGMSAIGPGYVPPEETHIGVLAERVHQATNELLDEALATARTLLGPARDVLDAVAAQLLEDETLDTATLVSLAGRQAPATLLRVGLSRASGAA